jgi:hypothetical protein
MLNAEQQSAISRYSRTRTRTTAHLAPGFAVLWLCPFPLLARARRFWAVLSVSEIDRASGSGRVRGDGDEGPSAGAPARQR